jgi:lipoprotein-releasing system permease protein
LRAALFLLKRYLNSGSKSKTYSFFSVAALFGIALGATTLVVALSVLEGYEKVISEKLTSFDSDIQVYGYGNQDLPKPQKAIEEVKKITGTNLARIDISAQKICILGKRRINEGVTLKGVQDDYLGTRNGLKLVQGSFDFNIGADSLGRVVIGKTLATKLRIKAGDMINFFAINQVDLKNLTALPAVENLVVSGIYESGMGKYDDAFAYINIKKLQKIYEMGEGINLIEVKLLSNSPIEKLRTEIQDKLQYPYFAITFIDANKQMFNWIELQRKPIPIVLGLIIIVAAFNIISALLMLVLDKTNSIGTLKALGATPGFITYIFLFRGLLLGIAGALIGVTFGFILCYIQAEYGIIKLNPTIYFVDQLPIAIKWEYFAIVFAISSGLSFLSSLIPAFVASRIDPIKALRFN